MKPVLWDLSGESVLPLQESLSHQTVEIRDSGKKKTSRSKPTVGLRIREESQEMWAFGDIAHKMRVVG